MRINPEMHIPEEASAVHGIYDEDVGECPTFKEVARNIANDIEGCDLAGFNSNRFDIPVLAEEFLRADVDIDMSRRKFVDVQVIFHKWNSTPSAAYKVLLRQEPGRRPYGEADTRATYGADVATGPLSRIAERCGFSDYSSFNKKWTLQDGMVYDDKGVEVLISVNTKACRWQMC